MNIYLLLLVLVVTSCYRVTIGSNDHDTATAVLFNSNNNDTNNGKSMVNGRDDQQQRYSKVTIDANSVVTSSEMQGATPKIQTERLKFTEQKGDESLILASKSSSLPSSSSSSSEAIKKESLSNNSNEKSDQQSQPTSTTTTHRGVRSGAQSQSRDNKLMSLLAARRSALQLGRFRTHRRVPTTNATVVGTTSSSSSPKNSSDPRTTCERNCTKNFTRRTTASCMRRCIMMYKVSVSTTTASTVPSDTASASPRTKVDEKDNNEILLTDESSHGFFVVTKELNDTVNHISSDTKLIVTSTEKNQKGKSKSRQQLSAEEIDMTPYVFFGRKLPPLKPTVLRISKVDDHPKVLEISVTKPTERSRGRTRYHPRDRNIVAYNRRHGLANLTRFSTTTAKPVVSSPVGLFRESSEEKLIKEATMEDNMTITILTRSAEKQSPLAKLVLDTNSSAVDEKLNTTEVPLKNLTSVTLVLEDQSTPLIISVPEIDEPIETTTPAVRTPVAQMQPSTFNIPYLHNPPEEKPNLIIFFNITTPKTTTKTSASHYLPENSTTPPIPTTQAAFTATTTTTTSTTEKTATVSPTIQGYTRTTVSSSVRSTVNPRIANTTTTTTSTTTAIPSSSPTITTTTTTKASSSPISDQTASVPPPLHNNTAPLPENFTFFETFPNVSPNFQEKNPSTSNTPAVEGNVVQNNEVTIEMQRINMATYVLAGLGMFPLVIIILYIGKTLIFKRRMKDDTDLDHCMNDEQPITPVRKMDQSDDDRSNDQYSISSDQEFDRSNLRFKSLLGEGNFGQVWKAEADDLSGHMGTTRIVAVKTVRAGSSQCGLKEEAQIMRKLGSHPNVVTLLGACIETEPHLLIMEYAMRGRLLSLLRAARSATNILPASVPGGRSLAPLSPRTLAGFALDIARGMEYISDRRIVHRDLAARNVLLDHNGVCKICDFGMSIDLDAVKNTQPPTRKADIMRHTNALESRFRFDFGGRLINHWSNIHNHNNNNNNTNQPNHEKKHHDSISKRPALPIRWMAPEALQYHIFSPETDVWAFGIVLWEIATLGCTPYPNLSGREVIRSVPNGTRPDPPKDGRTEFWDVMCRCWHKDPRERPTFREARIEISRSMCKWVEDNASNSDYMDVSGFSEDLEHGMVYFNRRISEFECEI